MEPDLKKHKKEERNYYENPLTQEESSQKIPEVVKQLLEPARDALTQCYQRDNGESPTKNCNTNILDDCDLFVEGLITGGRRKFNVLVQPRFLRDAFEKIKELYSGDLQNNIYDEVSKVLIIACNEESSNVNRSLTAILLIAVINVLNPTNSKEDKHIKSLYDRCMELIGDLNPLDYFLPFEDSESGDVGDDDWKNEQFMDDFIDCEYIEKTKIPLFLKKIIENWNKGKEDSKIKKDSFEQAKKYLNEFNLKTEI